MTLDLSNPPAACVESDKCPIFMSLQKNPAIGSSEYYQDPSVFSVCVEVLLKDLAQTHQTCLAAVGTMKGPGPGGGQGTYAAHHHRQKGTLHVTWHNAHTAHSPLHRAHDTACCLQCLVTAQMPSTFFRTPISPPSFPTPSQSQKPNSLKATPNYTLNPTPYSQP